MDITITDRHESVDQAAREYAEGRMQKILRLHDRLGSAMVVFDQAHDHYIVEGTVTAPQKKFSARAEEREPRTAIDQMWHKLEAQVRQWKDKLVDHHPNHGRTPEPPAPETE